MTASNVVVNARGSVYQGLTGAFTRMRRNILLFPKTKRNPGSITIGKMLSSAGPLPKRSLLLGQCKDRLPFLLQLEDPAMGAILISSDTAGGKTHQLQVLADSAMRLNHPHDLQLSVLTHNPDEWHSFWDRPAQEKYLYQIKAWYNPDVEQTIEALIDLAEVRRGAEHQGAAMLLLLDDFNFVEELSYAAQVNLHWLLAYGAQSGIWIVAAIKARYAEKFRYWINGFRTRIIGTVQAESDAEILSTRKDAHADRMTPGFFRIWSGSDWITYRLPLLGD